ncbi:CLUMA_CG012459, isoform A [Clunio marinus]|uniref:CLUMA_CG012459, isoform A n=1 Tax=Clunio marinus TaxID=568069 RepID=A0A1J1IH43_9DIPT|nr:CLUMA_CG012459, isoform A [Clunio marinus]
MRTLIRIDKNIHCSKRVLSISQNRICRFVDIFVLLQNNKGNELQFVVILDEMLSTNDDK